MFIFCYFLFRQFFEHLVELSIRCIQSNCVTIWHNSGLHEIAILNESKKHDTTGKESFDWTNLCRMHMHTLIRFFLFDSWTAIAKLSFQFFLLNSPIHLIFFSIDSYFSVFFRERIFIEFLHLSLLTLSIQSRKYIKNNEIDSIFSSFCVLLSSTITIHICNRLVHENCLY